MVASQQQQIFDLSRRLDELTAESFHLVLQREVARQAQEALERATEQVRRSEEDLKIAIPGVLTEVEFVIEASEAEDRSGRRDQSRTDEQSRAMKAAAEVKGLASRIAGLKASGALDTSTLEQRAEQLHAQASVSARRPPAAARRSTSRAGG